MALTLSAPGPLLASHYTSVMTEDQSEDVEISERVKLDILLIWEQLKSNTMAIQKDNLKTLIDLWPSIRDYVESNTLWGDEIEYVLLKLDHENTNVTVAPKASHVIENLQKTRGVDAVDIQREAYEYMVETSPLKPYTSSLVEMTKVEANMRHRRKAIQGHLDASTAVFSLSRFGMYGAQDASSPTGTKTPESMREEADALYTGGARYKPIFDSIESRRGTIMKAEASLYENRRALSSSGSSNAGSDSDESFGAESVVMDHPIYAVGGCAVQVNFGMENLAQAFVAHDQFCPMGPLMLALTAASPIVKGHLIETDARWNQCMKATDDRSPEQSHHEPRWSTSPMYFEDLPEVQALNQPLSTLHDNEPAFASELRNAGMPLPMAKYFAHALNRDPMMFPKAMSGTVTDGDLEDPITRLKTHFSAIWPHIRLKIASPQERIPWLIEFRSMETQPSDFEIAAMVVFLKLALQTILHYKLELRVPIQLVEENMQRAQVANAVEEQKFWFNTANTLPTLNSDKLTSSQVQELSLDQIFNGTDSDTHNSGSFPGLLHYVREYVSTEASKANLTEAELAKIESYIDLISRRASGQEPTAAKWMRDFVLNHKDYKGDSQVTQEMYYEMMCQIGKRSKIWS